ncbi:MULTISPECIES: hypothetical protein [Cyanophyceae]|jgi:hypothetical protein|uniref:hypothetical protein n=1 Tax=Cyanophyceae TaxID=3028117 RepID=UPI0016878560|nr:hypothetical protein [Trichocoleus sp. FACHB-832]MBD1904917.1 hypothetical protein [Trichocoleus sp. FACHB-832]MBD2064677.1 hypothetical protein [Trichocoleus sp. FACHB-6]
MLSITLKDEEGNTQQMLIDRRAFKIPVETGFWLIQVKFSLTAVVILKINH